MYLQHLGVWKEEKKNA